MTDYRGHVFSLDKQAHCYKCELCKIDISRAGELCTGQDPPKPPAKITPGSQEWLATNATRTATLTPRPAPTIVPVTLAKPSGHCDHPPNAHRILAPDVAWCYVCGSIARVDQKAGVYWQRPQARPPKEIEAMRAELRAVHSDLGDASQSVFDLFESLKEKEAEISRQIAEHRSVVGKLTDTIEQLKRDLEIAKNAL